MVKKKETLFLLIEAQINGVKINSIKSKCSLCGDRDKLVNHIGECSKLVLKEYKTRYDWVGKVINWKLLKGILFDHAHKWYIHKPESVRENKTHKILWNIEVQTDYPIPARPDRLNYAENKNLSTCGFRLKLQRKTIS